MKPILLYVTKQKPYINKLGDDISDYPDYVFNCEGVNGKIVAECDFEVEEIIANDVNLYDEYGIKYTTKNGYSHIDDNFEALLDDSCLNAFELNDYLQGKNGYAIHIKNLQICNKPLKLSNFKNNKGENITKAPQNMMYVFDGEEKKVLISIRPEWLCKILNGEKKIEVRKKVLKEMVK